MKMKIKSLVEKMGGVARVGAKPFDPVSRKIMSKYLDVDRKEFSDYLDYLMCFGGETYLNEVFYKLTMYNNGLPSYCYPSDSPIENVVIKKGEFGCFYGEGESYQTGYSLSNAIKKMENRIPTNFLPIAENNCGDRICLCIKGEKIGQIFYWYHENEWDEEDYFDDFGKTMPEEVKMQNMYLVGENLYDCFNRMALEEE